MSGISTDLPAHDELTRTTRTLEVSFIVLAGLLLAANVGRLASEGVLFYWWSPLIVVASVFVADLLSGLLHWTADTWFEETMPVLGRRFLRPFRVHHANPQDLVRRGFIDCNGDTAMITTPVFALALVIPLTSDAMAAWSLGLAAVSAATLPTNQIHQWAHMPVAPAPAQWLQRRGLILTKHHHARHHEEPYVENYCITTGWCNRWLTAVKFFPRCEALVTKVFGLEPRADEHTFHERW
jgi:ubiquitin-conjugating enzyme E2 variant